MGGGEVSLSSEIGGITLQNPLILASGILGMTASSLKRIAELGAGAVTTKSIGPEKRKGHSTPVMVEVAGGLLNSVGLSTQGEEALEELKKAIRTIDRPVIASFYGRNIEEFEEMAMKIAPLKPAILEVNISCPNVEDEFGRAFGSSPETAAMVTEVVKNSVPSSLPVFVKLTPNVSSIVEVGKAVVEAGADGITAINTVGPGMLINIECAKPVLSHKKGGLSGPAIKPIAVRCVYELYEELGVPIIGVGGVTCGRDVVEMLMAGASAVGVGTAIMYRGITLFSHLISELHEFMLTHGYTEVKQLIGIAHRR